MPETSGLFLKTGVLALYRRPDYAQALRRNHILAAAVYQQPGTDNHLRSLRATKGIAAARVIQPSVPCD